MNDDQASFNGEIFQTSSRGKVPPLVSTKCRIQDDGKKLLDFFFEVISITQQQ